MDREFGEVKNAFLHIGVQNLSPTPNLFIFYIKPCICKITHDVSSQKKQTDIMKMCTVTNQPSTYFLIDPSI